MSYGTLQTFMRQKRIAVMMRGKFFMKKIKLLVSAFAVALVAMLALAPAAQAQATQVWY